ncbi:phage tail protein [bacterium]|nr:phage tail protein [bacterium]
MYPKITNVAGAQAVLNNITKNKMTRRLNGKFLFDFTCYEQEYKTEYIVFDNIVEVGDYLFDINYIETDHDFNGKINYMVKCEHVSYRMIDDKIDSYSSIDTPTNILTDLLSGTDFTVGTVDFTDSVVFTVNKSTNKLSVIQTLSKALGGKLEFNGYEISILDDVAKDNGYSIRIRKNLKSIKRVQDRRGTSKLTYNVGVVDIFNSDELKDFTDLESLDIGDVTSVIDDAINENTNQNVIEKSEDVIKSKTLNVILSDTFDLITDSTTNFKKVALTTDKKIYGVEFSEAEGQVIERTDLFAKSIFNADTFAMMVGDGAGGYTNAIYFDIINKVYKFIGDTEFSGKLEITNGTIIVKIDPDGTDVFSITDAGVDIFVVDSSGNATYSGNLDATGTITGGSIIGGTVKGSKYFGSGASTAYLEIGAGGGNVADLTLNRSVTDTFFEIRDNAPGTSFRSDAPITDTAEFLSSYNSSTTMWGTWLYGSSEVINNSALIAKGYITGTTGFSGTFTNGDGDTVTVSNGLITSVI